MEMEMYFEIVIKNRNNYVIDIFEVEGNAIPSWEDIEERLKGYEGAFKAQLQQSYRMKPKGGKIK